MRGLSILVLNSSRSIRKTFSITVASTGCLGCAGAAGAFVGSLVSQGANNSEISVGQLAGDTAVGATVGALVPGAKVPTITSGSNSMAAVAESASTKLANGTISNVSAKTGAKAVTAEVVEGSLQGVAEVGASLAANSAQAPTSPPKMPACANLNRCLK